MMQWTFRMFWGCALALATGCTNGQIIEKIGKQTHGGVVLDEPTPSAGSEELNLGVIEPLGAYLETYQTSNQSEKGTAINIEPAVRRLLLAKQISLDDVIATRNVEILPVKIAFRVTQPRVEIRIPVEGTGWRVVDARLLTDNGGNITVKTVCTRDYSVTHRDCGGTLRSLYDCDATSLSSLRTLANTSRTSLPDFVPIRSDSHPSGRVQVAAY